MPGNRTHAEGIGQNFARYQVGHQRLAGRNIKGKGNCLQSSDRVNMPQLNIAGDSQVIEQQGQPGLGGLGNIDQFAAVKQVCHRPAVNREDHNGNHTGSADQPKGQRLLGEGVNMPEQRPHLHLAADDGNRLSEPQVGKLPVLKRWRDGHDRCMNLFLKDNLCGMKIRPNIVRLNHVPQSRR